MRQYQWGNCTGHLWYLGKRANSRKKIEVAFPNELYFVTAKANISKTVLNANKASAYIGLTNESNILATVNTIKKKAILQYYSEQTKLAWPPTPEQFSTSERNLPKSGHLFLTELFKLEKHSVTGSRNITRVVEPYAAKLVHGVSRGKLMTSKHFLLGLGIHNVTGLFDQII